MLKITRKADVRSELEVCLKKFQEGDLGSLLSELNARLLQAKVKFPLLEYSASELYRQIPESHQRDLCDKVIELGTLGGNVIAGILLQKRLVNHFEESMDKAAQYIAQGEEWYVSDIIGERVHGWALLHHFTKALPVLQDRAGHPSPWVVRSIGAGSHYAIKKGLGPEQTESVFRLLLSLAGAQDHAVKTGIGWAAKTAAKFHPEIVQRYKDEWEQSDRVGKWFRTKVNIGLKRYAHAQRD